MALTPDRIQQVKTTRERHGNDHYQRIGHMGGKKSSTKFTSESASKAANTRWQRQREQAKSEKGEQE